MSGREGFESACRDFFFRGDRLAGAVLFAIESDDPSCPASLSDTAAFEARLSAALDGRALSSLGDNDRAELRKLRDRIRGQFHEHNTEVQRTELELLLTASRERTPLLAGRHSSTPPGGDTQRLKQFVASHRSNVGAHPFLAGLSATLSTQLRQPRCVVWLLDDAVLTQSGGLGFAEASVELLVEGLGFEHSAPEDVEGQSASSHVSSSSCCQLRRVDSFAGCTIFAGAWISVLASHVQEWAVSANLSDDEIQIMLGLLPTSSELYARASGTRRVGSVQRRDDWETHRVSTLGAAISRFWRRNRKQALSGGCGTLALCLIVWLWFR